MICASLNLLVFTAVSFGGGLSLKPRKREMRHAPDRPAASFAQSIARGITDANAGRTRPATDVFDRLEARYRTMADDAK